MKSHLEFIALTLIQKLQRSYLDVRRGLDFLFPFFQGKIDVTANLPREGKLETPYLLLTLLVRPFFICVFSSLSERVSNGNVPEATGPTNGGQVRHHQY